MMTLKIDIEILTGSRTGPYCMLSILVVVVAKTLHWSQLQLFSVICSSQMLPLGLCGLIFVLTESRNLLLQSCPTNLKLSLTIGYACMKYSLYIILWITHDIVNYVERTAIDCTYTQNIRVTYCSSASAKKIVFPTQTFTYKKCWHHEIR